MRQYARFGAHFGASRSDRNRRQVLWCITICDTAPTKSCYSALSENAYAATSQVQRGNHVKVSSENAYAATSQVQRGNHVTVHSLDDGVSGQVSSEHAYAATSQAQRGNHVTVHSLDDGSGQVSSEHAYAATSQAQRGNHVTDANHNCVLLAVAGAEINGYIVLSGDVASERLPTQGLPRPLLAPDLSAPSPLAV